MADMLSQIESLNDTLAISDIDFKFVIHSDNQLFCIIIVDQEPVAEIAFDGNRSPMEGLKNWFERILLPFCYGERCPEFIDIYSNGGRARLIIVNFTTICIINAPGPLSVACEAVRVAWIPPSGSGI